MWRVALAALVLVLAGCAGIARAGGTGSAYLINTSPLCARVPLSGDRALSTLGVFIWRRVPGGAEPVATGLDGKEASHVSVERSQFAAGLYLVLVSFQGVGAYLYDQVLGEVYHHVPPDRYVPPEGHLGLFVGLTQDDVDHWATRQDRLMRTPADGGKLVDYPVAPYPDGRHLLVIQTPDPETACSLSASQSS
jgi:hypothetical protein